VPHFEIAAGTPHPVGVRVGPEGVNFSMFSQAATGVVLLLFDRPDSTVPIQTCQLDPAVNKTFHFWHILVRNCRPGTYYAFRVEGPDNPAQGHRFNPRKVLINPYARGIVRHLWQRSSAVGPDDNLATSMRCVVVDPARYDWQGDSPLRRPIHESIIYEMHVGGFTRSSSSFATHPGTFAAVVEKIPYLRALGITAVELLPVFQFDDTDASLNQAGGVIRNYWGYQTVAFFSPHGSYCVGQDGTSSITEFRDMVKALHRAGIEVILDVVFNHTDEGNELGPTHSFRGIDNRSFYMLDPANPAVYLNYAGVGNTFNANHPIAQKFIVDCLRYWVEEMHVDGFRFDEGSILSRGEDGAPLSHPPVIWQIELDDALADSTMIAEAWDAAGLYQVGHFPGDRWAEWNGRYRDDIRRFVKGDPGMTDDVASRLGGSADIYQARGQTPENSINFVTAHDGFTLNDLVSYNEKHNEANGEGNRDGIAENLSWNCGVEGLSRDPAVERLRVRQIKNFFTILMLSRGVPMMLAGDEVRRTQGGNNNPYNQDNATSWMDWSLLDANKEVLRFFQRMTAFRKAHSTLSRPAFYGGTTPGGRADITWHGTELGRPGFTDPESRVLACTIAGTAEIPDLHVMMNMFWETLAFETPQSPPRIWYRAIDTSLPSPEDFLNQGVRTKVTETSYSVGARSIVVLSTSG